MGVSDIMGVGVSDIMGVWVSDIMGVWVYLMGDSIESTPTLPKIRIPKNQPLLVLLHSSAPEGIGFNHFFSVVTLEKV